jgi:large subunit ribosomal protein L4
VKIPVLDMEGKQIEEVELTPGIFESEINSAAVHQVVTAILASRRRGTADTKTRGEVAGGGKKPWRQKGTGRARAGSIRSPLWKGGGKTFGPQPRDYGIKVPKKVKKLALKSALSAKAKASEIVVVDRFNIDEPKTRKAVEALEKLKLGNKVVLVVDKQNETTSKALRNLEGVHMIEISQLNVYDVLDNDQLVFSRDALSKLSEVLQ